MVDYIETAADRVAASNRTDHEFPYHLTINELIEEQVKRSPARPAIVSDGDEFWGAASLTYDELNRRANQVARHLQQRGIGPGDIVALLTERSFAMVIGILGILKAGAAYLPVPPSTPLERLGYILADAKVRGVLYQRATAAVVPAGLALLNLEAAETFTGSAENLPLSNRPDDLIYVIYTSGSTGRPKGVMIEHRSVVNRLDWMQRLYPIGEDDVILQKTSYAFDVSVWELFWWALAGARLALLRPHGEKSPQALLEAIRRHGVTVLHFVPSMLSAWLDYTGAKPGRAAEHLASLQRVFASGEALTPAHVRKFNALLAGASGARLTNLYGPTEATVDATYYDCPADGEPARVPIGRPIQNMRAYVVRDGLPLPAGETGELCLAGIGLARGYLNNPALTGEKFVELAALPGERIYRTGDLARWLPDGNLEYLGREDHQVKIRGLRIELGEIEDAIRSFPGVADSVVIVRRHSESIVVLVAYLAAAGEIDLAALRTHLQARLPDYMLPGQYHRLDAIPLTPSGKADRKALT